MSRQTGCITFRENGEMQSKTMTWPLLPVEPEQVAAIARWLGDPDICKRFGAMMPLRGDTRIACERRVLDVASGLRLMAEIDPK
jgi:hypothetical protein